MPLCWSSSKKKCVWEGDEWTLVFPPSSFCFVFFYYFSSSWGERERGLLFFFLFFFEIRLLCVVVLLCCLYKNVLRSFEHTFVRPTSGVKKFCAVVYQGWPKWSADECDMEESSWGSVCSTPFGKKKKEKKHLGWGGQKGNVELLKTSNIIIIISDSFFFFFFFFFATPRK